jgi:hypothetical protein
MKPITREELDRWKQLAEAATAGPWEAQLIDDTAHEIWIEGSGFYCRRYPPHTYKPERLRELLSNAEFIAAARDAVPRLVAEVERLTGVRVPELLHRISEQREEILTAFVAKYGCGPDECEQVVQRSPDGEKYWVRLRKRGEE